MGTSETQFDQRDSRSTKFKMKVIASLVATTLTQQTNPNPNPWIANPDAPHCGCQIILDTATTGQNWNYINQTCSLNFKYPTVYGDANSNDPHFVSVASSYMVGRERDATTGSQFKFTGYEEVSNKDVLDILVFYEQGHCFNSDLGAPTNETEQSEEWLHYNLTSAQMNMLCEIELSCVDTGFVGGVHLGNFNYDIARSVQTYTVPIYGLEKDQSATFDLKDYYNEDNDCMNALAHSGHGTVSGCSTNSTDGCSGTLTFNHDQDHNGLLEYFQFEPVSPTNNPICFAKPIHHVDDYQWKTPSPWDTQQAFAESGQ